MEGTGRYGPRVLVVDDDRSIGRLVRIGLETEGCDVVVADSVAAAHRALTPDLTGVVLDRRLPDGDGLSLLSALACRCPDAAVVVHSTLDSRDLPPGVLRVAKGDVAGIAAALGVRGRPHLDRPLTVIDLIRAEREAIEEDWRELCHWDPMLPPDSSPPRAGQLLTAVERALERPQPLGWGPDAEVEEAAEAFAADVGSVEVAIEQLVCLREALTRRLSGRIPPAESEESQARMHMLIDRAIGVAAQRTTSRLESEALTDSLTGLFNRRALERNVRRELSRASRYGRTFTVIVADLDGLKVVNDTYGHAAGDGVLRSLAVALSDALRAGDTAYRIGGDEFAVLLPETPADHVGPLMERISNSGAPPFSWGAATFPDEADAAQRLLDLADRRLYQRRAERNEAREIR